MKTFAIATLGCKVNTYESQGYEAALLERGYTEVSFKEKADIYIINTCAVTNTAASKSRQKIHQAHALNPTACIAVVGCYVQSNHDQVADIDGVSILVGSKGKSMLVDQIEAYLQGQSVCEERIDARSISAFEALKVERFEHQTRAFLKIQDGCNQFCSYCIIPYARGAERSLAEDQVIESAKQLVNNQHLEIVLTGIHTGRYGNGTCRSLLDLLKRLVAEVPKLRRIRISSIEMNEISDELIAFMKEEPRIARHLHIPLQAASNTVLQRMRRPYTVEWFMERVAYIRSQIADISISSDVITGFPQESEEEFMEGYRNIEEMQLSFLHVFPYSKRDFTDAAKMPGHLDRKTKKARGAKLAQLSKELYTSYKQRFIGQKISVLFEKEVEGMLFGHSSEYLEVYAKKEAGALHTLCDVLISELKDDVLYGVCVKEETL